MSIRTAIAAMAAKTNTRKSILRSAVNGSEAATNGFASWSRSAPRATPAVTPSRDSTRLSVSNWTTNRLRLAPKAALNAISFRRVVPFASTRFATFAQAMSKTVRTRSEGQVDGAA